MPGEPDEPVPGDGEIDDPLLGGLASSGSATRWQARAVRPHPRVALFEVQLSGYQEYMFVVAGEKSISVTRFDPSDETHLEPETFVFAKPYQWDLDPDDDEALLQVWQAIGVQR